MVVKFAIQPSALTAETALSPRDMRDRHKRIIELWERYGFLVDPGKGEDSISSRFDDAYLKPVRSLWIEAWKAKKRCRRGPARSEPSLHVDWTNVGNVDDLAACADKIDVALVEPCYGAVHLAIPDDDQSYNAYCGNVEAVIFPFLGQSDQFSDIIMRTQVTVIPAGESTERIWYQWFQKIAQKSARVTIIDRYACTQANTSGLISIMALLGIDNPSCQVVLWASNPDTLRGSNVSRQEFISQLEAGLNENGAAVKAIHVLLVRDDIMTRDRYVSFDEFAFHTGHGLPEIFSQNKISQNQPCTLDVAANGIGKIVRDEEKRLSNEFYVNIRFEQTEDGRWCHTVY